MKLMFANFYRHEKRDFYIDSDFESAIISDTNL